MEALTAVAVACLTVYDMVKSVDRSMTIHEVKLLSKTGGTRGTGPAPTHSRQTAFSMKRLANETTNRPIQRDSGEATRRLTACGGQ